MKKFYVIKDVTSNRYLKQEEGRNYMNWTSYAGDGDRFDTEKQAEKFIEKNPDEKGFFEIICVVTNSNK
jgi:hypothetical protein